MTLTCFDSHCHLQDEAFQEDREEAYHRARAQNIGMIVPGYTIESSIQAVQFAQTHEGVWALVGVHPHDAATFTAHDLKELERLASEPKVVGIGEIGLDYHYMNSPKETQKEVFLAQVELAKRTALPVSVHSREAESDTVEILRQVPGIQGVLHCFTGDESFAANLLALGFYISFAGPISFKSAHALRQVVTQVPSDRLLIETDSPYLSPAPWRGQRNEPLRVIRVAEVVAAQKNFSTQQVFAQTTANILNAFPLIEG